VKKHHIALDEMHAQITAAIADLPAEVHPSDIADVLVCALAQLIAFATTPEGSERVAADIARSLPERVAYFQDHPESAPDRRALQ
jgi:hypothetical protein